MLEYQAPFRQKRAGLFSGQDFRKEVSSKQRVTVTRSGKVSLTSCQEADLGAHFVLLAPAAKIVSFDSDNVCLLGYRLQ